MSTDALHMTIREAGVYFQRSEQTIRKWVNSGRVQSYRLPGGRAIVVWKPPAVSETSRIDWLLQKGTKK